MSAIILKEPNNLGRVSVSKVKTFKDCKAKFKFSYIEKLPKKEWEHLKFGLFLHEILENFHKLLLASPELSFHIAMKQVFDQARIDWKEKLTKEVVGDSFKILIRYLDILNDHKRLGTLPTFKEPEQNFYIAIDDKLLLNGFIDVIKIDSDGVLHVADYKTSKSDKYLKKDWFQLLTYAYVMCLRDPTLQKVRVSYIMLKLDCREVVKEFSREDIMKVEETFLGWADQLAEEKLFRPKVGPLCRYCDFAEKCPEGASFIARQDKNNGPKVIGFVDW